MVINAVCASHLPYVGGVWRVRLIAGDLTFNRASGRQKWIAPLPQSTQPPSSLLQVLYWVLLVASLTSGELGTWAMGWPRNPLTGFFALLCFWNAAYALHKVDCACGWVHLRLLRFAWGRDKSGLRLGWVQVWLRSGCVLVWGKLGVECG